MKRRLILMRHAKSSWADAEQSDHERPLNERGRRDAPLIARRIEEMGWVPQCMTSSDSTRTRETWELMAEEFGDRGISTRFSSDLYLAGLAEIRSDAAHWPAETEVVIALGHNPGWEEAVQALAATTGGMATANAALLEGEGDTWAEALRRPWKRIAMLRPVD